MGLNICTEYPQRVIKHIMSILITIFSAGYRGKAVDMAKNSENHRTTIAHFLNSGKWDSVKLEGILKKAVIRVIYEEARRSGKPVYCIVDDTIASKTKPSLQAMHPIDGAYFHYSHLKRKQDYGHQAVAVMLCCNGIKLHYATLLYDKTISKIQLVCNIAKELPEAPVVSYFLCDSWYTCPKVTDAFIQKGFYTIGALKTNRILYPSGIRQKLSAFALHLRKSDAAVRLVTVGNRQYYVFRYEGSLNGLDNAVVLITYPKDTFLSPKALRAFLSMDTSLSTQEILDFYTHRWAIEVYFRQCRDKLAFAQFQIRSAAGIRRFWLLSSLAYFICCTGSGSFVPFQVGFASFSIQIRREQISFIYHYGAAHLPLDVLLSLAA